MSEKKYTPIKHLTKTQMLALQIGKLAQSLGPDARLPTMRDLCERFDVSGMTINRALSELEAQGVLVRRQGSGTYVAPAKTGHAVALVCDRDIFAANASPFLRMLVDEARRRADELGEKFSFFLAEPGSERGKNGGNGARSVHDDLAEAIEARRVGGVLFAGEANPAATKWLEERVPLVALSYTPSAAHRVRIDHAAIVREGVRALAGKGCKRIALWIPVGVGIGRRGGDKSFPELDAYKATLKQNKLAYDAGLVWRLGELDDSVPAHAPLGNQEQGLRAAGEVFGSRPKDGGRPDGIVIDDDMMARGALTALAQAGLKIGRDIQIASHTNANSGVLLGYEEKITLLEIDPADIVNAMYSSLEALMAGRPAAPETLVGPRVR